MEKMDFLQREKLTNAYRDKSKQTDHLNQLSMQFDTKLQKLRQELADTSDKVICPLGNL